MKKIDRVKKLFNNLLKLEEQTGTLAYDSLAVDQPATVDGAAAPDGEYKKTVDEVEKIITVKDGMISAIKDVEVELSEEEKTTAEAAKVALAEAETLRLAEIEKEKILNVDGLKLLFSDNANGSGSIYFEFVDGVMVWGDVYTSEYKTILSSDIEAKDAEIVTLKADLAKKEKTIVALSEEGVKFGLVQAPIEDKTEILKRENMTESEKWIEAYKK